MSLRITVPDDLEKDINRISKAMKLEPSDGALKLLKIGVSRKNALTNYAGKDGAAKPAKKAAKASPKKAAKAAPKAAAKAAPVKAKAGAKGLRPKKAAAAPAESTASA